MSGEPYRLLVEWHRGWKRIVKEQQRRGLNDFNLLTTVLDPADEVRLHSRFLREMLDPSGSHGQGSFFLELFLDVVGGERFVDLSSGVSVRAEWNYMDLFVASGAGRVIVENKIHASDQERQIQRYLDFVFENERVGGDEVLFLYLTIDGRPPSEFSLGDYRIEKGKVVSEKTGRQAGFRLVSYQNEICEWARRCQSEVRNITNLSLAFDDYLDVIMQITGKKRRNIMSLVDFLGRQNNPREKMEIVRQWRDLYAEFPGFRKHLIHDGVLRRLNESLKKWIDQLPGWVLDMDIDGLASKHTPLTILPEGGEVGLALEFDGNDYHAPFYGICRRSSEVDLSCLADIPEYDEKMSMVKAFFSWTIRSVPGPKDWWVGWSWYRNKKDMLDLLIDCGGEEELADDMYNALRKAFDQTQEFILWANEVLRNKRESATGSSIPD